jgi:DNA-binding CsgD family transcriptional regulator
MPKPIRQLSKSEERKTKVAPALTSPALANSGVTAEPSREIHLLPKLLHEAVTANEASKFSSLRDEDCPADDIDQISSVTSLNRESHNENGTAPVAACDDANDVGQAGPRKLCGLTRREAALAKRLLSGKCLDESAAELLITSHAARTLLKRIFTKARTYAQPGLAG